MDTVKEETSNENITVVDANNFQSNCRIMQGSTDAEGFRNFFTSSRCLSVFRHNPSQTFTRSNSHAPSKKNSEIDMKNCEKNKHFDYNKRLGFDALTTVLSALYAKCLVVLGAAFPITEIISNRVPTSFYQGFYLYMYSVSVVFVLFTYWTLFREKSESTPQKSISMNFSEREKKHSYAGLFMKKNTKVVRYGSFYLRLGAIAFGIGSMVYSGLDFGQYFELKGDLHCNNLLVALTPAARMILTMVQIQFIFLNTKDLGLNRHTFTARFGLMHMIATNLCEWLHVLIEETKHEIVHMSHKTLERSSSLDHANSSLLNITENIVKAHVSHGDIFECKRTNIMGSLVQNVAPFLFPCTVEYSLICAVVLFEMWKHIKVIKHVPEKHNKMKSVASAVEIVNRDRPTQESMMNDKIMHHFSITYGLGHFQRSAHHFSVDCKGAHRGLFSGIIIIVMTIISLIMFFVLNKDPIFQRMAIYEVSVFEMILYIITLLAVIVAMIQMRNLKFFRKNGGHPASLSMDTTLLIVAQTGVFMYSMFSMIGSYFTLNDPQGIGVVGLLAELFSLIQTVVQTLFVLGAWRKRIRSKAQIRSKPGRQVVTFLLVANIALWISNTMEKGRAEFKPTHLDFFGMWPWTIITHVSMPLVIFYRFHSTICLFEIWKNSYKIKAEHHHHH